MVSRRTLLAASSAALLARALPALQSLPAAPTTRLDLARIDSLRILARAETAVAHPPAATGGDLADPANLAFLNFTLDLPALAAACLVRPGESQRLSAHAASLLDAWFLNRSTRPTLTLAGDDYQPLLALAPLAETIVALPFFQFEPTLLARLRTTFAALLITLTTDRTALLARDAKDHHASAWLLLVAALARFTAADPILADCRHRFRTVTLRAQVAADGLFPHELTSPNPFRDTLFNLDLLAGACVLLFTRFESIWDYELQDGPGMRVVIARLAPYIRTPSTWPFRADATHFHQLPCRRPALAFAARAYAQPQYAELFLTLNPDPTDPDILRAFPIRQPILWLPLTHTAA